MRKEHPLAGLEPDNLLAFLALVGFHRCVAHARPEWSPRVYWGGIPVRPKMVLAQPVERGELLEATASAASELAEVHSFGRANLDYSGPDARKVFEDAGSNRLRLDLLSALMSDAAVREGRIRATPFCAMFGQGHQNFLERLESVPQGVPPRELRGEVTADDLNSPKKLEETLFQSWERADPTESFRWDPQEDRRYALRFDNPSGDKALTVHGANRLAALGLPLLTAVPIRERGEVRLYAIMTNWEAGGIVVSWPIWSHPATLGAVRRMIAGCGVEVEHRAPGLHLARVYHSRRITVGKFFNFTRATPE